MDKVQYIQAFTEGALFATGHSMELLLGVLEHTKNNEDGLAKEAINNFMDDIQDIIKGGSICGIM